MIQGTPTHDGSMVLVYMDIYGNIYHQYTPNVSIYTSTMDPMGYESFIFLWPMTPWKSGETCSLHDLRRAVKIGKLQSSVLFSPISLADLSMAGFFSATGIKVDPDDGLIDLWPYGTIADFAWYIGRMVWGAEEWNQTIEWQRPRSRILWFLGRIQP